jgi:hypothetical protein
LKLIDLLQLQIQHLLHGVVKLANIRTWMIFIHHNILYYDLHLYSKKFKIIMFCN